MRYLPAVVLATFITAGLYKRSDLAEQIPVDLTVLLATATLLFVAHRALGSRVPREVGPLVIVWACFLPGIAFVSTEYGAQKVAEAFTLTLLASIAPLFLIRSPGHLRVFMWTLAAVSGYMAYLALSGRAAVGELEVQRITAGELNTIVTGRALAFGLIWLVLLVAHRKIPLAIGAVPAAAFAVVLVGTGARGPLLGAVLGIAVALLIGARSVSAVLGRLLLAAGFTAVLYIGYLNAPFVSQDRLLTLGNSGGMRLRYFDASLELIAQHPLGVGWGNWQQEVGYSLAKNAPYPHNLLLEVASEGGWIAGVALLWFMYRVLRSGLRGSTDLYGRAALAFYLFATVNAMVSDDLIGARFWFATAGIILAREAWSVIRADSDETSRRALAA